MIPKVRLASHGGKIRRIFYATVNYFAVMLQIFFAESDIFWVANCPDILVIPLVLRRKRYILEYRSPWAFEVKNEFSLGSLVRFAAIVEKLALKHADLVTVTTTKLVTLVKDFRKPIFVIPNYPLKTFGNVTISREKLRRSLGYGESDKILLFVGKLTRVEGADLLPKIVEAVLKRMDVILWIVGDGPLYPSLEKFAEKLPKKVKLFGWQPHEKIPNFVMAADVCIAPRHTSTFSVFYNEEGLQKFSEYMFFEKPIVTCGVAESTEYLLVDEDEMADGIIKTLKGRGVHSKRKTWEEYSEKEICSMFDFIQFSKLL